MSDGYVKVHSSILHSTIWLEDSDTRVVWVTMMTMADCTGYVGASVPGLAKEANVSLEACQVALKKFMSPDEFSRTPDFEGRRIEPAPGGWRLLNHEKYRIGQDLNQRRQQNREAQRRHRQKIRGADDVSMTSSSGHDGHRSGSVSHVDSGQSKPLQLQAATATAVEQVQEAKPRRTRKQRADYPQGLDAHLLDALKAACREVGRYGPRKLTEDMRDHFRKLYAACEPTPDEISHVVRVRLAMDRVDAGYGSLTWDSICVASNFRRWLATDPAKIRGPKNGPATSSPVPLGPRPAKTREIDTREAARRARGGR